MNEIAKQLRERVKRFAVRILKFVKTLPRDPVLKDAALAQGPELESLRTEAGELRAIFKASHDTARANDERFKALKSANRPISPVQTFQNSKILNSKSRDSQILKFKS